MRETLILVEKEDHALAFYDVASGAVSGRVALPAFPHELFVDVGRGYALVGHYGVITSAQEGAGGHSVIVVDCAARRVVNTLDCRPHGRIHGIGQDDAGRVYALSESDALILVFDDARATGRPRAVVPTGGRKSHLLTVCRDGRTAFATNLLTGTVTKAFPSDPELIPKALSTGLRPEGVCLSDDERTLFAANRGSNTITAIATRDFTVEAVAEVRPDPLRIYRAGPGRLLVVFHEGRGVSLMNRDLSQEIAFLPMPGRPTAAWVAPDGERAFVSVAPASSVELDLAALKVMSIRQTGRGPDACCVVSGT